MDPIEQKTDVAPETVTHTNALETTKVGEGKGNPADGPTPVVGDSSDSDALKAKIAALESALAEANKVATTQTETLSAQLKNMQAEATSERRTSALNKLGLPAAYHDVAPKGDPKDPTVAESLEKWATAHPLLLQSRAPAGPQIDLNELAKKLPGGKGGLTSMANMQANWEQMRGGK